MKPVCEYPINTDGVLRHACTEHWMEPLTLVYSGPPIRRFKKRKKEKV